MTLTIELPADLARWLEQEAARRGQEVGELARALLVETRRAAVHTSEGTLLPGGVQRRSPAELLALAREQGIRPAGRFEELLGDWSDAESDEEFDVDAFLDARKQWQREGGAGFPFDEANKAMPRKRQR